MIMPFQRHPQFELDSRFICDLSLCEVRLSNNAAFPWIILIPRLPHLIEMIDLSPAHATLLYEEILHASRVMKQLLTPTKLNIANLGNIISQLHVHIVARFSTDLAWPQPIWNSGIVKHYDPSEQTAFIERLANALQRI